MHEYETAINFSSLVLSSFPKNVKALFRRAIACMKTNMLMEAQTDLETASMLESKNKDILRELNVVKNLRAINHNGKRSIEDQLSCEVARESKRPIPDENTADTLVKDNGGSSCVSCISPLSDSTVMDTCISDDGNPINLEGNSSPIFELDHNLKDSQIGDNEYIPKNSVHEFSRKGGGNSRLRISGQAYQKMLQGSKVNFYNKRDLSTMTIRILNTKVTKEGGIARDHYKRKKRRRRSKKRKPKTEVVNEDTVIEDTVSCSGAINGIHVVNSRESFIGVVNSSSSSICDDLSPSGSQILQGDHTVAAPNSYLPVSLVHDTTNTSICFQAHKDPSDHESFLFSGRKKCKIPLFGKRSRASPTRRFCRNTLGNRQVSETKRIFNFKKNHRLGDESLRHNLSTCSTSRSFFCKSLRPRGVSVSCCRYSSEAQLTKKNSLIWQTRIVPSRSLFFLLTPFLVYFLFLIM